MTLAEILAALAAAPGIIKDVDEWIHANDEQRLVLAARASGDLAIDAYEKAVDAEKK